MATASLLKVVGKGDLDSTWIAQDPTSKLFKVVKAPASADAGNLLVTGSDNFPKLIADAVKAAAYDFTFGLDPGTGKLTLTRSDGVSKGAVDPHAFEVDLANASLASGVITFKDGAGNTTATLDTTAFLTAMHVQNGNGYTASGNGTSTSPITLTLVASPTAGNLLKIDGTGLHVDPADISTAVNNNVTLACTMTAANGFVLTVGNTTLNLTAVELQDCQGNNLGLIFAPQ